MEKSQACQSRSRLLGFLAAKAGKHCNRELQEKGKTMRLWYRLVTLLEAKGPQKRIHIEEPGVES